MKEVIVITLGSLLLTCNSSYKNTCNCINQGNSSPVQGIPAFRDLQSGFECAYKCRKPILLWFTAWSSISDRQMEERIFTDDRNYKTLENEFVIISLYVDDRKLLPEDEWYHDESGKLINTIGKKNSKYQADRFKTNSQPFFVIFSPNGQKMVEFGYLPDAGKVDSILVSAVDKIKRDLDEK